MALRIAIDGLHLFGQYSGVHYALARSVEALRNTFSDDELLLFVPSDFEGPPATQSNGWQDRGLKLHRTWFKGNNRTVRTLWRNFRLQTHAYRAKCDLLHGATYALPAAPSLPAVLTLHDLIALSHPEFCTPGSAKLQKRQLPRSARVARRIQVPTHAVRLELERLLQVPTEKIDVVPWGVGAPFRVIEDRAHLEAARQHWKLPERLILHVGNLEPKKNIDGLIRSFFAAKMHAKLPHALVFVGKNGWGMYGLKALIRELGAEQYVFFTQHISEEALVLMYNLADCCVLNSHIEGFGLPVLEAMACGCPTLVSDIPALVEIAGSAAYVVPVCNKQKSQPLREALELLLSDKGREKRAAMKTAGLEQIKQYAWERTARLMRASYEKALGDAYRQYI